MLLRCLLLACLNSGLIAAFKKTGGESSTVVIEGSANEEVALLSRPGGRRGPYQFALKVGHILLDLGLRLNWYNWVEITVTKATLAAADTGTTHSARHSGYLAPGAENTELVGISFKFEDPAELGWKLELSRINGDAQAVQDPISRVSFSPHPPYYQYGVD